ncbi:MAG: GNAT family N-acetyltransferase, partial [Adlercreutzia sp.]|nr:GNAT family N-acetyltransferase [Adlercreutzia sp.]
VGVSSLDAVAWGAWGGGARGELLVVADAMRREVYPVRFALGEAGALRLSSDRVVKAQDFAEELVPGVSPESKRADEASAEEGASVGEVSAAADRMLSDEAEAALLVTGDALRKYADLFAPAGTLLPEEHWTPTGVGLLLAVQAAWRAGECDPFDTVRHNPAFALPVYTRLSDAEENERVRLAKADAALAGKRGSKHVTMNDTAIANARANGEGIAYKPLDARHVGAVAALESRVMGSDAWSEALVADELGRADRVWWAAYAADPKMPLTAEAPLVGYAGGWVVDGDVQILKVGVDPAWRRHGIARALLARVADDARNLGARTSSLEVRAGNAGAQALYEALGYRSLGKRPRYYSDGEDAVIMEGPLPTITLASVPNGPAAAEAPAAMARPLILAIESSCDETAAAIIDGEGTLLSDVVASQVDFHARFGGVVPEIASRKHIEAICGVCDDCLERAAGAAGLPSLRW